MIEYAMIVFGYAETNDEKEELDHDIPCARFFNNPDALDEDTLRELVSPIQIREPNSNVMRNNHQLPNRVISDN